MPLSLTLTPRRLAWTRIRPRVRLTSTVRNTWKKRAEKTKVNLSHLLRKLMKYHHLIHFGVKAGYLRCKQDQLVLMGKWKERGKRKRTLGKIRQGLRSGSKKEETIPKVFKLMDIMRRNLHLPLIASIRTIGSSEYSRRVGSKGSSVFYSLSPSLLPFWVCI